MVDPVAGDGYVGRSTQCSINRIWCLPVTSEYAELSAEFVAAVDSPRTARAYRRDLDVLGAFLERIRTEPADVRRYHLIAFRDQLERDGLSPATANRRVSVARSFLKGLGADVGAPVRSERSEAPGTTIGLDDLTLVIGAVTDPGRVVEGVASLLFAARVARVDDLLDLGHDAITGDLTLTIGEGSHQLPRFMRPTVTELIRQSEGGPLFQGMTRQTLTRRVRSHAAAAGVDGCTPRVLRRSSNRITIDAVVVEAAVVDDPAALAPADRLDLIAAAIRSKLLELPPPPPKHAR